MKKKLFKIIMIFAVLASILMLASCLKSDKEDFTKIKVVLLETDGVKVLSKQSVDIKPGNDVAFNVKIAEEYAYLGMTKNGVPVREEEGVPAKEYPIEGEYDEKNGAIKLKAIKYPTTVELIVKPKSELYSFELMYNDRQGGAQIVGGTKIVKGYKWLPQTDGKVSLVAYPHEAYSFNGWSVGAYIEDGGQVLSYDKEFEFVPVENTVLYANFSDVPANQYKIVYQMNGGKVVADGKSEYEYVGEYNSQFVMQQTLMSDGSFTRPGYVAVGYSTQKAAFESYESVNTIPGFCNMGGVCKVPQSGVLALHVVWARETAAADFTFSGGKITKYNGTSGIVVIPEKINGTPVTEISAGAFKNNKNLMRLVIPKTVKTVKDGAFENCTALKDVIFFDSLLNVTDNAFKGCTSLSTVTLNSQRLPKYSGQAEGSFNIKYGRLKTLTDKKIVVVAGSSALYGINSKTVEKNFPGYSILNYGTDGNTSAAFYLDVIDNYIQKGDIVIHTPELSSLLSLGDKTITPKLFRGNEQCYDIFREVDMTKYTGFFTAFGKFQNGDPDDSSFVPASNLEGKPYQTNCNELNVYGDWNEKRTVPTVGSFGNATETFNTSLLNYANLNSANAAIVAKGGVLLMSYAPRDNSRIHPTSAIKTEYDKFTKFCEEKLDYPVISNVGPYMLEHAYFYDSEYHCNDSGAVRVTDLLMGDLKRYLADPTSGAPIFSNQLNIVYNANGGKANGVSEIYEVGFDRDVQFSMQQTLWSNGTFIRDGYVAVGYSTEKVSFEGYNTVNEIPGFSNMGGVCEVPKSSGTLWLYVVWAKETASTYFEYTTESDGTVAITKYTGSAGVVVIPEYIDGRAVSKISAGAFKNKTSIKRLVIPKSVISLEDGAFEGCTNIKEVVFFDSVLYVTDNAFKGCNNITTITLNSQRLPKYSGSGEGTFCIKYERVRTLRNTKKIIVVSGSSTMHSLNSAVMENNFPGYSVVNYGTNIANCSLFFLDVISNYVVEGDLVIHAPEMDSTVMGNNLIKPKMFRGNEQCYDIFREVDMTKYTGFWSSWGKFQVGDSDDSSLTPAVNLTGRDYQLACGTLNMYGDYAPAKTEPRFTTDATAGFNKNLLSTDNAARLNWVNGKIKAKGGHLLMSFATRDISRMNTKYTTAAYYNDFTLDCENKLDYAVISNVGTYLFDHSYFYDSEYHCNDSGAALRTSLLSQDIRRYLAYLENPTGTFAAPKL